MTPKAPLSDKRIGEIVGVIQTQYAVMLGKDGKIRLKDFEQETTYHTFNDWHEVEAWAIEQGWE